MLILREWNSNLKRFGLKTGLIALPVRADVLRTQDVVTRRGRALSKTRTRNILLYSSAAKTGRRASSCHSTRPRTAGVRLCVAGGEEPGANKYETNTPLDPGGPPAINRSTELHSSCEDGEDEGREGRHRRRLAHVSDRY